MNTLFSDYSKPAYFYRLFHEGGPFRDPPTKIALAARAMGVSEKEFMDCARADYGFVERLRYFPSTDFLGDMPHVLPQPPAPPPPPDEFDFPAFQKATSHFMRTGEIIRKDGQPLSEEQREKAKALHAKELRMPHTSPVDPLDGVW